MDETAAAKLGRLEWLVRIYNGDAESATRDIYKNAMDPSVDGVWRLSRLEMYPAASLI